MRVSFVSTMLVFGVVLGSAPLWAEYEGGTGTPDDPYQIATAAQLISIGGDLDALDKHFVLIADIDLDPGLPGGRVFQGAVLDWPVQTGTSVTRIPFSGVFDGSGHIIRNMVIDGRGTGPSVFRRVETTIGGPQGQTRNRNLYVEYYKRGYAGTGLFAVIGGSGRVKDLGLEDVNMPGVADYAGCLAGSSQGRVTNCHATGRINSYGQYVGGLLGCNSGCGAVIGCYSDVEVVGRSHVGGLAGYHAGNIISNCYAGGNVTTQETHLHPYTYPGEGWYVGGLVGYVYPDAAVVHCAAHGAVTGGAEVWSVGGLVGFDAGGLLLNCCATGDVTVGGTVDGIGGLIGEAAADTIVAGCYSAGRLKWGPDAQTLGGLIGWSNTRCIRNCYCLAEEDGGGPNNDAGVPLRLHTMSNSDSFAGWDFETPDAGGLLHTWVMSPNHRPELTVLRDTTVSPLQGQGTTSDPYRVRSQADLTWVVLHPDAIYQLEADIDLGSRTWSQAVIPCFAGILDGQGHTVRDFGIGGHGGLGLFSHLGRGAVVTGLHLADVEIDPDGPGSRVGVLAGISGGTILACSVTDSRIRGTQGSRILGGLVGKTVTGAICSCTADAMVGGRDCSYIGGLVGSHNGGIIRNCFTQGRVVSGAPSRHVGGLVGNCEGAIMDCLSMTTVSNDPTFSYHGGFAGAGYGVIRCYYLSSQDGGGPNRGRGSPLTHQQMRRRESFVGWDFTGSSADGTVNAWTMSSGESYPLPSVLGAYEPPPLPGSGCAADPHLIGSAEGLGAIYYRPDLHYRLTADIDCGGIRWTGPVVPFFTGHLDGSGFSLSGLQTTGERAAGLFGFIAMQAMVHDLVLNRVDLTLPGEYFGWAGSLAGYNEGMVRDCHVLNAGTIQGSASNLHVGGLVGQNTGVLRRCSSYLPIRMPYRGYRVGGLVGMNLSSGIICECCAGSQIVCGDDSDYIGGLVGAHEGSLIVNCYGFGSITAGLQSECLGGLVGSNSASLVTTCCAWGSVTANGGIDLGGIVGSSVSNRYVENCYFLAPGYGGGPDNGLGSPLTHGQMCRPESFIGWDFAGETINGTRDVWTICVCGGRPRIDDW